MSKKNKVTETVSTLIIKGGVIGGPIDFSKVKTKEEEKKVAPEKK